MTFKVALIQARPDIGDVKANIAQVVEALKRESAPLVVFPEMFLPGYLPKDGLPQCVQREDGAIVAQLIDACRETGKHLIVGAAMEAAQRGVINNSLLLIGPAGLVGRYDKVYLPTFSVFEEALYFAPGNALPVFEVTIDGERVKLGLCICYDLFFPEITKALALAGADVLVCASASPSISRKSFEAIFPARAVENTAWLLYTNIAGVQDTLQFWGGATAFGPRGDLRAKAPYDVPHALTVEVDLEEVADARRRRPTLRDTRPEVLRGLLKAIEP